MVVTRCAFTLLLLVAAVLAAAARAPARPPSPLVVIDPGHDRYANPGTEPIGPGSDARKIKDGGGTRGVVSGIAEADVTLAVSLELASSLQRSGVRVLLTRNSTERVSMGNVARVRIANRAGASLFIRIHADGSSRAADRGTHTLHPARRRGWTDDVYESSRRAAGHVQRSLVRTLGFPDRGLDERADITGFNWADVPTVLTELGFLTNPTEDRLLSGRVHQRRAALGLCRGALAFLERSTEQCSSSRS